LRRRDQKVEGGPAWDGQKTRCARLKRRGRWQSIQQPEVIWRSYSRLPLGHSLRLVGFLPPDPSPVPGQVAILIGWTALHGQDLTPIPPVIMIKQRRWILWRKYLRGGEAQSRSKHLLIRLFPEEGYAKRGRPSASGGTRLFGAVLNTGFEVGGRTALGKGCRK